MEHRTTAQRLAEERNIWLASSRDGHPPHLVPVWFVWTDDRFWICMSQSVKARNMANHPAVTLALETGDAPVVVEGEATLHERPYPDAIWAAFGEKFQWDINRPDEDGAYDVLAEIVPTRWVFGKP